MTLERRAFSAALFINARVRRLLTGVGHAIRRPSPFVLGAARHACPRECLRWEQELAPTFPAAISIGRDRILGIAVEEPAARTVRRGKFREARSDWAGDRSGVFSFHGELLGEILRPSGYELR